eukprot:11205475-Lingulodinium_polyedra.AAC.1
MLCPVPLSRLPLLRLPGRPAPVPPARPRSSSRCRGTRSVWPVRRGALASPRSVSYAAIPR